MSPVRPFVAALVVLIVQLTFAPRMAIAGVLPDFVLLLLVMFTLRRGPLVGTLLGFSVGLVQDLLDPVAFGANALAKCIVGWVIGKSAQKLAVEGRVFEVVMVAIALLLHDLIYLLCVTRFDLLRLAVLFLTHSLPAAVYTGAFAFLLDLFLGGLRQAIGLGLARRSIDRA